MTLASARPHKIMEGFGEVSILFPSPQLIRVRLQRPRGKATEVASVPCQLRHWSATHLTKSLKSSKWMNSWFPHHKLPSKDPVASGIQH